MLDTGDLVLVGAVFALAGTVKGIIGLGLPSVSLGLLTMFMGLPSAIVLMLAPSFVTNAWQGLNGPHLRALCKRTGPFMLAATLTIIPVAVVAGRSNVHLLSALMGAALALYAIAGLAKPGWSVSSETERWAGPVVGAVNGVLTGLTGSFVVPGVAYLQALGLPRDALVQAMGVLFTMSTAVLGATLAVAGSVGEPTALTMPLAAVSLGAVIPALLGMRAGQWLRGYLSETQFRRVFFWSLAVLGLSILGKHVIAL